MSGLIHDGNCCKSCWYRGLMVIAGIGLERPDKTGHYRTLGEKALKTREMALAARQTNREGAKSAKRTRRRPATGRMSGYVRWAA